MSRVWVRRHPGLLKGREDTPVGSRDGRHGWDRFEKGETVVRSKVNRGCKIKPFETFLVVSSTSMVNNHKW